MTRGRTCGCLCKKEANAWKQIYSPRPFIALPKAGGLTSTQFENVSMIALLRPVCSFVLSRQAYLSNMSCSWKEVLGHHYLFQQSKCFLCNIRVHFYNNSPTLYMLWRPDRFLSGKVSEKLVTRKGNRYEILLFL